LSIGIAYLVFLGYYSYAFVLFLLTLFLAYRFIAKHRFLIKQLLEFSEAVKYRDFTRRFVVKNRNSTEGKLFQAFNQINEIYKNISIDQALQHQYLNKVINMLDTAILFFHADTGKVI